MEIPGFANDVTPTKLALIDPFCVEQGKVMVFKAQITLESPNPTPKTVVMGLSIDGGMTFLA